MGAVADVQSYLETQGIIGGVTGWSSIRRRIHDGDGTLDKIVSIAEDGGRKPEVPADEGIGDSAMAWPAILITVRAEKYESDDSEAKAMEIFEALNGITGTVGTGQYLLVEARTSAPVFPGFDERERPLHTIGFMLMREL